MNKKNKNVGNNLRSYFSKPANIITIVFLVILILAVVLPLLSGPRRGGKEDAGGRHFQAEKSYDFHLERTLDQRVLIPWLQKCTKNFRHPEGSFTTEADVSSTDRTVGTLFGAEVVRHFGENLPEDTVKDNQDKIQKLTDKYTGIIDKEVTEKEKEVMTV